MRAVFAYKILDHFWKPKDSFFWDTARLAVKQASKFYLTELYADKRTYEMLQQEGIYFDYFVDCSDEFHRITEHNYGLAKMFAMLKQTRPYILLDLDTIIFSNISSDKSILYGHKEINLKLSKPPKDVQSDLDYIVEYYENSFNRFLTKKNIKSFTPDWNTFPSNCFLLVNSPLLVCELVKKILNEIGRDLFIAPPPYTVQFYEQFLLYNYLLESQTDMDFIYETAPVFKEEVTSLASLYNYKYIHLDTYDREIITKNIIKKLVD